MTGEGRSPGPGVDDGSSDASVRDRSDLYEARVRSRSYRRERPEKARIIAHICGERLARAERVGDLGSGTGIVKRELEAIYDRPVLGFEIDAGFIEEEERMVVADVHRLPVPDGSLDFAVANHLYEHVEDQPLFFRELRRVLAEGGEAYVSAGNRLAVVEPHYRLPFLSWMPRPLADLYLRVTGRGSTYRGIRFRTYGTLRSMMERAGLRVRDETERAIDDLLEETWGRRWVPLWRLFARLPELFRRPLLRWLSPQWFFLVQRPAREEPDGWSDGDGRKGSWGRGGAQR